MICDREYKSQDITSQVECVETDSSTARAVLLVGRASARSGAATVYRTVVMGRMRRTAVSKISQLSSA